MFVGRGRKDIKEKDKIEQNNTRRGTLQGAKVIICHKLINITNSAF